MAPKTMNEETRALVKQLASAVGDAAEAWVRAPSDDMSRVLQGVPDIAVNDRSPEGERVTWTVLSLVAYCIGQGNRPTVVGPQTMPNTKLAGKLYGVFLEYASARLALMCIEATKVDPRVVADEDNEVAALLRDGKAVPADAVAADAWMARHWGSAARWAEARQFLGAAYRSALQAIALHQATEREERARDQLQRSTSLGSDVKLPQAVVRGWQPDHFTNLQARIDQQELFAPDEHADVVRDAASVLLDRSQLGNLTTGQVRALVAVFRVFTTEGDDAAGKEFRAETLQIPAMMLYRAAGIANRSAKLRKEFFESLDELASRQLYLAVVVNHAEHGEAVVGERTPLFHMRPYWFASEDGRKKNRENLEAIAREWTRRGLRDVKPEWTGPLPDYYEIKLPQLVRQIGGSLVMSAEVLDRLDRGSKLVRGPACGFRPLDFRLWMEITQRTQGAQPSADGLSLRSFVDRNSLLVDIHGAEKIDHARASGRLRGYIDSFEKSAQVMVAGGLARWEPGHTTRRKGEDRDVFIPAPELIGGLGKKARAAVKKAERQLALGPGK